MIRVKGLTVAYDRGNQVFKDIDVEIPGEKITCILGPNGAGKTTLLKAIAKMIGFTGEIYLDGYEVSKTPLKTIARILSYASHIYVNELLSLTVLEALLISRYPVSTSFLDRGEDYEEAIRTARSLNIENLLNRKLSQLSSGELQRIILAMVFIKKPKYILFDEPDSHIDPGSKSFIARIMREWSRRSTVVLTTQDILFGMSIGEYFIVLNRGNIVFQGGLKELIKSRDLLEKVFGIKLSLISVNGRKLLIPLYSV